MIVKYLTHPLFPLLILLFLYYTTSEKNKQIRDENNKTKKSIPYTHALANDTMILFMHLDLYHWIGEKAIKILYKVFYRLHGSDDDNSKFWSNLDVRITFLPKNHNVNKLNHHELQIG